MVNDSIIKEYPNEIPLNTVRTWANEILTETHWQHTAWSGNPKEPFRHWCNYTDMLKYPIRDIWNCIEYSLKEDGYNLDPNRIILNLYNHGDSSWLHQDSKNPQHHTVIVYLNDFWDLNWGGFTIFVEDGEIIHTTAPKPGKFVIFKSNMLHGPTAVSREAPYPRLGLTFQCT